MAGINQQLICCQLFQSIYMAEQPSLIFTSVEWGYFVILISVIMWGSNAIQWKILGLLEAPALHCENILLLGHK